MQLFHGSSSSQVHPETSKVLGPSAFSNPFSGLTPREMDKKDMDHVVRLFAQAAVRAKKAGFDGVQLHAGHSGLLSQFLSSGFNRRTDEYGGTRENRYRLIGEIYQAIRESTGRDFPIWIKIDSTDVFEDGLTTEDFLWNGRRMAEDGFDAVEVSGMVHPRMYRGAYYREAGERLSEQINKSVILTGGLRNLKDMLEIANESRLRFFGMSTPFIRYPDYLLRIKNMEA
jgi:2,4-dienoyl-CoA reductase-like NADH-dependent reductase (Old Yellow Enzyme family)